MKKTYTLATLGLGTFITVLVSLACSYWFFYSLMGSTGYQAIGAGIAGCAIQLFGYGFAASFLPLKKYIRFILCIVPLALSMLSTYSALYGYLTKERVNGEITAKKQQMMFEILEQSAKDKKIAASAAEQGVGEAYRTQAKGFLQMNDSSRDKDERLLKRLEEHHSNNLEASPLDGLVRVTGDNELTTVIFCVWLAIMFDMLPVIAIGVISQRRTVASSVEKDKADTTAHHEIVEVSQDRGDVDMATGSFLKEQSEYLEQVENTVAEGKPDEKPKVTVEPENTETEKQVEPVTTNHSETTATTEAAEEREVSYDDVVSELKHGRLKPNYKAVQQYTGWSQWKAQEFFKHCQDIGVLEKEGRTFKVVNNLAVISQVKKAVNS